MNILKALRDLFPHESAASPIPEDIQSSYRAQWTAQEEERKRTIPQGLRLYRQPAEESLAEPVALSPDGRYITSGAMDGSVRLWDPATGDEIKGLLEHSIPITVVAWSESGLLASGSRDTLICLWNVETDVPLRTLMGHSRTISTLAWSPDESMLASGAEDKTVRIWDVRTGEQLAMLASHPRTVRCVAWSPDGEVLASADDSGQIRLWDAHSAEPIRMIDAHIGNVLCLAWSPTQPTLLASSGKDAIVRIWDTRTGRELYSLEGHAKQVTNLVFSPDGRVLISQSILEGAEVYFWHTGTWELLASLPVHPFKLNHPLAFQTNAPLLLTGGDRIDEIRIWQVDIDTLLQSRKPTVQYSNAKVVLTGDSGVGKTGLFDVISGKTFRATESTHARHVFVLDEEEVPLSNGSRRVVREKREVLLWDLAGQPGYRVIHQLHLNQVTLGLVVFDGRSETDPFAGVRYWDSALRLAHNVSGQASLPLKKLLIAARVDRGGIAASKERIDEIVQELGFERYIETSAKEGYNIDLLRQAIREGIEWSALPHITSNELFETIKAFLLERKETGPLLARIPDLYTMLISHSRIGPSSEALYAQFERCIALVEARNLIMRLRFGRYILLQPERLDAYASGLVNSVRDEPDGLGSILEARAKECQFRMPSDERIQDKQQERLLLLAMIQDMLRRELALLEQTSEGNYLIFPSQSTRVNKTLPDPQGKALLFEFGGSLQNIYATLAVRLSRSEFFKRKDMWKDAIRFTASTGGQCGLFLETIGEGHGRLTLFFDAEVSKEMRFSFENYVEKHLQRWAATGSVHRFRLFTCPECGEPILHTTVFKRRGRGFDWLACSNCETHIDIKDNEERLSSLAPSQTLEMDTAADRQRNLDVLRSIRREEVEINVRLGRHMSYYDLFLCYNPDDRLAIQLIGDQLLEMDILPWFDEWEVQPEQNWLQIVKTHMSSIDAVAVFVGQESPPWQDPQVEQLLRDFSREHKIVPVILPDCEQPPRLPDYIEARPIDMRALEPDPVTSLIERIKTG
jgi:small GTP-binding protein